MNILRAKLFICTSFFLLIISNVKAQELLTNASIIQMKELGFDDSLIISKIETSEFDFKTSIPDIAELKKAGVSDAVLSKIMHINRNNNIKPTGIYFNINGTEKLIEPTTFFGTSTNAVAQILVSDLINAKQKAQLIGATSKNIIEDSLPKFTFIFNHYTTEVDNLQSTGGLMNNWFFNIATSPNQFALLRLDQSGNVRKIVISKANALSNNQGFEASHAVSFKISRISNSKFTVIPDEILPNGEYCFVYIGAVPNGKTNQSVFDFSIQHKYLDQPNVIKVENGGDFY